MSVPITEPVEIGGQVLSRGMEIQLKGKRGRFRYLDATMTNSGKVVLNLVGPIGAREHYRATYLENVKRVYGRERANQA